MNYLKGILGCALLTTNSFAIPALPSNLIKLAKDANPKCVEYVVYNNETYCSLTPLGPAASTPVSPDILKDEKQNIQFDNRPWKAAWGKQTPEISTIEYIVVGDDINNWKELVTTQFLPLKNVTPVQFGEQFLENLSKSGVKYTVDEIENTPTQLIYEFKVQSPDNLQQDEIQKITQGKDGLYVMHYAIKTSDMDDSNRKTWITNLKNSTLKN